ncbi:hypothetical protein IEO21_08128 [Rhodonia placenta]|uniref:histidine kinase n=1 Tax=Rhodonia placenta TaxID=104341 RepID=A0A8H7NX09_9APHY|nr:hypothetical protein IEO21_08128 [Postia placenta]
MPSTQDDRGPRSLLNSVGTGTGSISSSIASEEPRISFRHQHIEDKNGHHLIVGREGKLSRCEDEPIRTPGAAQGFGVLIAVEENEETGNLEVRQVSENSTELLGLSPPHLFSLECFSKTLPEHQSDVLFDNIQYLNDTTLSAEEQAENVHVFMLSGWGEPGTVLSESMSAAPEGRRSWTCCRAKPLLALERLRRTRRSILDNVLPPASSSSGARRGGPSRRRRGTGAMGMMDVFAVMAQINEQLGAAPDLDAFLKVVAGFDELWNGQVVAELVDWKQTHDLFGGLHFPASDIPAQARHLYALNKVRLLYDRGQPTARLVVRSKQDLQTPLINTMPSDQHPSGYIVSNADDLLGLFDADHGVLVIGEGAKILGPNQHGQEILIVAEYLRLKQFNTIQVSQAVTQDYPDLQLTTGLEVIAGLLYVPLSAGGRDFIAFLRKGQPKQVRWAGRPYKDGEQSVLEPRASFRTWSETVAGRSRAWSDEHLETAGVLALVYGKFIEVWRQKENALQTTKLTNLLLSNASHEGDIPDPVRTPLNHIINYLELALNGSLDTETRENLSQSHAASKSLLFTINDLLDLTRLESGNATFFNEVFNLHRAIEDAVVLYRNEAVRRGLGFRLDVANSPRMVVGDARKIRTVVANLTANALKYTEHGYISVECRAFDEPMGLRTAENVAVEIIVSDTGCGIPAERLECIFREFEQVESTEQKTPTQGLGLGLAVVARIVEQLGGQLRVDSKINEGSRFSFLIPFSTEVEGTAPSSPSESRSAGGSHRESRDSSAAAREDQIDNLVEALSSHHLSIQQHGSPRPQDNDNASLHESDKMQMTGFNTPSLSITGDDVSVTSMISRRSSQASPYGKPPNGRRSGASGRSATSRSSRSDSGYSAKLRLLIVEDNDINRMILAKRLSLDGHNVVNTTNGQEGVEMLESDWEFDCVLMDLQMPLLNGFEATQRIRQIEQERQVELHRVSHKLNGRIPIFAVSASLFEDQREELFKLGFDGWILKPIDFKRLKIILRGVVDAAQRGRDVYNPAGNWEVGGWLKAHEKVPGDVS